MDNLGIKIQLTTIPETPGVYQFYDSDEKVIFVIFSVRDNFESIF